ncbi:hypothetical protein PYCC9005_005060 [Savitreella phatthalungensis]
MLSATRVVQQQDEDDYEYVPLRFRPVSQALSPILAVSSPETEDPSMPATPADDEEDPTLAQHQVDVQYSPRTTSASSEATLRIAATDGQVINGLGMVPILPTGAAYIYQQRAAYFDARAAQSMARQPSSTSSTGTTRQSFRPHGRELSLEEYKAQIALAQQAMVESLSPSPTTTTSALSQRRSSSTRRPNLSTIMQSPQPEDHESDLSPRSSLSVPRRTLTPSEPSSRGRGRIQRPPTPSAVKGERMARTSSTASASDFPAHLMYHAHLKSTGVAGGFGSGSYDSTSYMRHALERKRSGPTSSKPKRSSTSPTTRRRRSSCRRTHASTTPTSGLFCLDNPSSPFHHLDIPVRRISSSSPRSTSLTSFPQGFAGTTAFRRDSFPRCGSTTTTDDDDVVLTRRTSVGMRRESVAEKLAALASQKSSPTTRHKKTTTQTAVTDSESSSSDDECREGEVSIPVVLSPEIASCGGGRTRVINLTKRRIGKVGSSVKVSERCSSWSSTTGGEEEDVRDLEIESLRMLVLKLSSRLDALEHQHQRQTQL